jgi:ParB family chromosome partitioning protein
MSRSSLGRGLAALIPDSLIEPSAGLGGSRPGPSTVPLSEIHPNPEQPRSRFDAERLEELASSLREHGVLSPLVVRPRSGGGYVLIAGERRLRAAGLAGLEAVPVVVREDATNAEIQLELALVENLQREDLDPIESARGYKRLQGDFGYTQEEISTKIGKNRSTVANALRLLRLPEKLQDLVQEGRLSTGHAKALLALDDDNDMLSVAVRVLEHDLSVRATERLVKARLAGPKPVRRKGTNKAILRLGESLSRDLETHVDIRPKARGGGGRIVIEYYSPEELERLIEHLRRS